ncbi:hypothetical protein CANCADRAFT_30866 [Tortispora caseinolytica NRRL Y-17796]|uniref:Radical SAM core domain-containing protein n=1 Tax=Tortispora caseinolytica NRRL Y-17796 TaxID=767744 RepID=A0A1E4TM68_9ASCO|nr:hypothetical protein CANCADRAFT_30866 [Tortispora caseinolytica NRRL Y-17796]
MRRLRSATRCVLAQNRRHIRIQPQFLVDMYHPRYTWLTDEEAKQRYHQAEDHLHHCNLCPHKCNVDRYKETGYCMIGAKALVSNIGPHLGEESCLIGTGGSGTIFFSGCNLRCVFCQNYDISHVAQGEKLGPEELADWMIKLQDVGRCPNINLVTPEHVVPIVAQAILCARDKGLKVPIVYNTSAFDALESLDLLHNLVDIYMPDFKVWEPKTAARLLKSSAYPEHAKQSIKKMHEQVGNLKFTFDGLALTGVLVRHLVMPHYIEESKQIMRWIAENLGKDTFVHIMEQYFPHAHVGKPKRGKNKDPEDVRYAEINRPIRSSEYEEVVAEAKRVGLWRFENADEYGLYA